MEGSQPCGLCPCALESISTLESMSVSSMLIVRGCSWEMEPLEVYACDCGINVLSACATGPGRVGAGGMDAGMYMYMLQGNHKSLVLKIYFHLKNSHWRLVRKILIKTSVYSKFHHINDYTCFFFFYCISQNEHFNI